MLTLRIERLPVLATEKEAIGLLVALADVLASAAKLGLLWARFGKRLLPFDAGTIEPLLAGERSLHAYEPGRCTHILSLSATPEGPGEVGVVLINVRPDAPPDAAPGITFSVSLSDDVLDTGAPALHSLLERCIDAVAADAAVIGPDAWVRDLGAGWATFAPHLRHDALPAGASIIHLRAGSLILAHAEEPASESASARVAVGRVHEALQEEHPAAGPPPAPLPSDPRVLAEPAPELRWARWAGTAGVGETDEVNVAVFQAAVLPFVQGGSALARRADPPSERTGTPSAPQASHAQPGAGAGKTLRLRRVVHDTVPFPAAMEEPCVEGLSLARYARLCAEVTAHPERAEAAFAAEGLADPASRRAIDVSWRARLASDPDLYRSFQNLYWQYRA
jgi:hypothetical protein